MYNVIVLNVWVTALGCQRHWDAIGTGMPAGTEMPGHWDARDLTSAIVAICHKGLLLSNIEVFDKKWSSLDKVNKLVLV